MRNVKVDDVIKRVHTKVDKDNTDLLYYASGEQVDEGRLLMDKRGLIEGSTIGPMFYYGFKRGDFLIPSRSISSHKASVATYDGICSEKTFVLDTADESVLLHDYLPFVFQNERFWTYAERTSHGSTNAFLNWKALRAYEFPLPSVEEQREIADLLWAANRASEDYRAISDQLDELVKSRFVEMFGNGDWPKKSVSEVASDIRYGTSKKASEVGTYTYLRMNNMTDDGRLDFADTKRITLEGAELEKCLVRRGDVLFNRTNSREKVGKTAVFENDVPMVIAGYIIRVRFGKEIRSRYFSTFMNLPTTKKMLRDMAKGAVHQANISARQLGAIEVPVPPIDLQDDFIAFAEQADKSRDELRRTQEKLRNVSSAIVRERVNDIHV